MRAVDRPVVVRQAHHDETRELAGTRVVEAQSALDVGCRPQPEQLRALPDRQHFLEVRGGGLDVRADGFQGGVTEQGSHDDPVVPVVAGGRQPHAPVVGRIGEVEPVEPVARVVAVPVERLRPQHVDAGVDERDTLAEDNEAHPEVLHAHPVRHAHRRGSLELDGVEQRLVVVGVDVVDVLLRIRCVAGLLAVVVELAAGDQAPVAVHELVVGQVAGEREADPVLAEEKGRELVRGRSLVGRVRVVEEAGEVSLLLPAAERPAATGAVADAVVEGADAGAGHVGLGGVDAPRVVGHLPEVPALAVDVDLRPFHSVRGRGERIEGLTELHHVALHVVAHDVEAEAVDLVGAGPGEHRVDEELLHHVVLAGRVLAAGAGLDVPVRVQPVVVARDHAVEHRLTALPGGAGVVVDDVDHDPQSLAGEGLHHLAELADAGRPVGVGGVAALRHRVVPRVVAPVEGVLVGDRGDRRLLLVGVGGEAGQVPHRGLPPGLVLVDGGDVERRQQVDVGQAGAGERGEVLHAVGVGLGERLERPPQALGHARIAGAEVAHVQLVEDDVLRGLEGGLGERVPLGRLQRRVGEVDDLAPLAVAREAHRVGIGHEVALDAAGRAHVHLDLVQVELAVPARIAGERPPPRGSWLHVEDRIGRGRPGIGEEVELDRARGGSPQPERGHAVVEGHAERAGVGVEVVEHARDLERRGIDGVA